MTRDFSEHGYYSFFIARPGVDGLGTWMRSVEEFQARSGIGNLQNTALSRFAEGNDSPQIRQEI
jgi:hypothetical protein